MSKFDFYNVSASDLFNGVFKFPSDVVERKQEVYPGIDDESFKVLDELRCLSIDSKQKFILHQFDGYDKTMLLVGLSGQCAFFWCIEQSRGPVFYWLLRDDIKQRFYTPEYTISFSKVTGGCLPGEPPLMKGLDWRLELDKGKYFATCINPPVNSMVVYSDLSEKYGKLYSGKVKSGKATAARSENQDGFASISMRPTSTEPKP